MKRSKAYYDAAQAKMKKDAEERKAKAEQLRIEQERIQKQQLADRIRKYEAQMCLPNSRSRLKSFAIGLGIGG